MSFDSSISLSKPNRIAGWLDWFQMLSGLILVVFLFVHMLFMGSIILGSYVFNSVAFFFEKIYLDQIGGFFLLFVFLFHAFLGARKIPFRTEELRSIINHSIHLQHRDTWLWVVQVITGFILFLIGSIHMWTVLSGPSITAEKVAIQLNNGLWIVFYLLLIFSAPFHGCIGLYRIGIKWGFITRASRLKSLIIIYSLIGIYVIVELINLVKFLCLDLQ